MKNSARRLRVAVTMPPMMMLLSQRHGCCARERDERAGAVAAV